VTIVNAPFKISYPHAGDVLEASRIALKVALNLQPTERILIMANPDGLLPVIAQSVYNSALDLQAYPTLLFQAARSRVDLADPATLAAIRTEPDVMFTITQESLGNDPTGLTEPYKLDDLSFNHIFYYLIATEKARGAWCPSADLFMFRRTVPINYPLMWNRAKRLKKLFDRAESIHVTSECGTDMYIGMAGSDGMLDDGDYRFPGTGGNLPAGEVFSIPNKSSNGVAVIDGTAGLLGGTLLTKTPFKIHFKDGKVVSVEGGYEAETFEKTLNEMKTSTEDQIRKGIISPDQADVYRDNCWNLAEFGVGLNPSAIISGNMTEDEKALDTCHIAVGDDCYGYAPAVAHLDLMITHPLIELTLDSGEKLVVDPKDPQDID